MHVLVVMYKANLEVLYVTYIVFFILSCFPISSLSLCLLFLPLQFDAFLSLYYSIVHVWHLKYTQATSIQPTVSMTNIQKCEHPELWTSVLVRPTYYDKLTYSSVSNWACRTPVLVQPPLLLWQQLQILHQAVESTAQDWRSWQE